MNLGKLSCGWTLGASYHGFPMDGYDDALVGGLLGHHTSEQAMLSIVKAQSTWHDSTFWVSLTWEPFFPKF